MATGKLTFQSSSAFQADLRQRVDSYFREHNLSRAANGAMLAKTFFWLAFTYGAWGLLLAQVTTLPVSLLLWVLVGFGLACIGFNIGHDAIHGSYSEKAWVNSLLAWTFDVMGASSYTWSIAHNTIHHTYTNIPGVDHDLEPGPWLVFYPQKTKFFHRFQHLYAWPLYSFVGFIWVYVKDYEQMRRKDPLTGRGASASDWAKVLFGKVLHMGIFLFIPLLVIDAPKWQTLLGYTLLLATGGITLAIVFQLAHCIEGVVFPRVAPGAKKMTESWADHQMRTTANFGRTPIATFICGGLDHQIEHHLLPRICHIHYPKIAPIVAQCAKDHGLPYVHNGSFFQAVAAHYRTLKKIGNGETAAYEAGVLAEA